MKSILIVNLDSRETKNRSFSHSFSCREVVVITFSGEERYYLCGIWYRRDNLNDRRFWGIVSGM